MAATRQQARDEILAVVKAAVDAYNTAHSASVAVIYDDVDANKPDGTVTWIRAIVKHGPTPQQTLGAAGNRRFLNTGMLFAQVFTPFGDGNTVQDPLSDALIKALRQHQGETWFHGVAGKDVGKDGPWFQVNVTTEFLYHEAG